MRPVEMMLSTTIMVCYMMAMHISSYWTYRTANITRSSAIADALRVSGTLHWRLQEMKPLDRFIW